MKLYSEANEYLADMDAPGVSEVVHQYNEG